MSEVDIAVVELVVDRLSEAAFLFVEQMGFRPVAEVPQASENSLMLEQGGARILLTPVSAVAHSEREIFAKRGIGVRDISLATDSLERFAAGPAGSGGWTLERGGGVTLSLFNGLSHTLVNRSDAPPAADREDSAAGVVGIDHVAICLTEGDYDTVVRSYQDALSLQVSHTEYVATDATAMNSTVLQGEGGRTRLVFLRPMPGREKSQIQHFIDNNEGAGVQHIAFAVDNAVAAVDYFRSRGIAFLAVPARYYDDLEQRIGSAGYELEAVRQANLLVDRDETGLLFQAFTRPLLQRGTLFIELVERAGATGFGSANIKALFKAVEDGQRA